MLVLFLWVLMVWINMNSNVAALSAWYQTWSHILVSSSFIVDMSFSDRLLSTLCSGFLQWLFCLKTNDILVDIYHLMHLPIFFDHINIWTSRTCYSNKEQFQASHLSCIILYTLELSKSCLTEDSFWEWMYSHIQGNLSNRSIN
jgi:hypothetical protein